VLARAHDCGSCGWGPTIRKGYVLTLFAGLLLPQFVPTLSAENLYVTPSGAGSANGSSWSNAFAGFSGVSWGSGAGQLGAGDTLWVGGGTYNHALELKGSGSAGNLLNIKRARSTDTECTSVSGWSAGYDSQVVINPGTDTWGIWMQSPSQTGPGRYIIVDGRITDGIRINPIQVPMSAGILIWGQASFNSTFRYIEIYGPSTSAITSGITWVDEIRGIEVQAYPSGASWGGSDVYPSDLTFEYCTISGLVTAVLGADCERITYQHNNIHTIECLVGEPHGNIGFFTRTLDLVFRYNEVHDSMFAVGLFFTSDGNGGVPSRNAHIYGNIFRDSTQPADRCIEVRMDSPNEGPFYIYNNTFVHVNQGINIVSPLYTGSQSYIRNNLFVDVAGGEVNIDTGCGNNLTVDNNKITTSYSMFVNAGSTGVLAAPFNWQWVRDLHLNVGSSPAGLSLSSPFNIDFDGRTRGADGVWDVGAYEYVRAGTDTTPPAAPSRVRVN